MITLGLLDGKNRAKWLFQVSYSSFCVWPHNIYENISSLWLSDDTPFFLEMRDQETQYKTWFILIAMVTKLFLCILSR